MSNVGTKSNAITVVPLSMTGLFAVITRYRKKIVYKLVNLLHITEMRRHFGHFGIGSRIMKPFMLTNPDRVHIGNGVLISEYSRIEAITYDGYSDYSPKIIIGDGARIEQYFHVGACELVEIGENVLIASRVYISDHNHRFSDIDLPIKLQGVQAGGKVIVERNAWLGEGCAILAGVTIGKNSVIGANAVVTKDIPPYSVAVGIPAKVIKQYDFNQNKWLAVI